MKNDDQTPPEDAKQSARKPQVENASQDTDAETAGAREKITEKRSEPAKAFAELKDAVFCATSKVDEIDGFVRIAKDKLLREADEYRMEGRRPLLQSLFQIHDLLYKRVTSMESRNIEADSFVADALRCLEGELESHGVSIFRPHLGDPVDAYYMECLGARPARFWRTPNTVARVYACGFLEKIGNEESILRKAAVDVYRKT